MRWLYREVELIVDTSGLMSCLIYTDLPGHTMLAKRQRDFSTEETTTGRAVVHFRLPGYTQGNLIQVRLEGDNTAILYGGRVLAKPMGIEGAWAWHELPIVGTPEGWSTAGLPILPTPEGWDTAALPIAPTQEGWSTARLPLPEVQLVWGWFDVPIDEAG